MKQIACLALAAAFSAPQAYAQTAATPVAATPAVAPAQAGPAKTTDTVSDVVVTGQKAQVTSSIDRKSYNVARDLQSATGSIADVLRNIPSVDVDLEGNVRLRGAGVQILVDGKPSPMFSGAIQATMLQQQPAGTFETIEVMTNPSAEFSPDGAGGIINLVTKRPLNVGKSGSLRATGGSFGKWLGVATGAYTRGPMTLSGDILVGFDPGQQSSHSEGTRTDPILGQRQTNSNASAAESEDRSAGGSLRLDYNLTPRDKLNVSVSLSRYQGDSFNRSDGLRVDGSGAVIEDLHLESPSLFTYESDSLLTSWRHNFAKSGEVLVLNGRYSRSETEYRRAPFFDYDSSQPDRIDDRRNSGESSTIVLSANYTLPLANKTVFKTGYDFRKESGDSDEIATTTDPLTGVVSPLPNITNHFVNATTNHQAFVTYQRPFGKLSMLGGVRLEEAAIDYDQQTTAIAGSADYFQVHPSLHLQYDLTDDQKLNLSYSHRVQRPNDSQLNPFVSYSDPFNAFAGNPALRPQETHSVEGGWEWIASKATVGATLFYRQNYNTIGSVSRFLTPQVILSTYENQGTSRTSGLALTATGKLGPMLSYNASSNLFLNEIRRSSLAGGGRQDALAYTAQGNLDFRITARDFIQTRLNYSSRQINSQGFRKASGAIDLGYQRKIRDDLVAVLVVSDIFKSARSISVTDTPVLTSITDNYRPGRTFAISLTRQFGGKAREAQFDYSTGSSGPGAPGPGGGL